MSDFEIHPQLRNDCILLGRFLRCHVLLMNNAAVPWLILVPENADAAVELTDLSAAAQAEVLVEINAVAALLKAQAPIEKLNIAALGNIVSQLHIHVVGRHPADYCWPKLVWAADPQAPYDAAAIAAWREQIAVLDGFVAE